MNNITQWLCSFIVILMSASSETGNLSVVLLFLFGFFENISVDLLETSTLT